MAGKAILSAATSIELNNSTKVTPRASSSVAGLIVAMTEASNDTVAFLGFSGTSAANKTKNISTDTSWTSSGYVKVQVNGSDFWVQYWT